MSHSRGFCLLAFLRPESRVAVGADAAPPLDAYAVPLALAMLITTPPWNVRASLPQDSLCGRTDSEWDGSGRQREGSGLDTYEISVSSTQSSDGSSARNTYVCLAVIVGNESKKKIETGEPRNQKMSWCQLKSDASDLNEERLHQFLE